MPTYKPVFLKLKICLAFQCVSSFKVRLAKGQGHIVYIPDFHIAELLNQNYFSRFTTSCTSMNHVSFLPVFCVLILSDIRGKRLYKSM